METKKPPGEERLSALIQRLEIGKSLLETLNQHIFVCVRLFRLATEHDNEREAQNQAPVEEMETSTLHFLLTRRGPGKA